MRPKITRSDFLVKFFTGEFSIDDVETVLLGYPYVHGAYTLLKPFDLDQSQLISATMNDDANRITLHFSDDKLAKKIKKECKSSFPFCGEEPYSVTFDLKGKFLTLSFE